MNTCKECGHQSGSLSGLSYHIRSHGISYIDYVVKHEHDGQWPHCVCGKKLEHKKGGFPRFCSKSCASSGTNNPMHGKTGDKCPNYGMKRTADQLKNYSEGAKKRWQKHGDMLRDMMKDVSYRAKMRQSKQEQYDSDPSYAERIKQGVHRFWSESPLAPVLRAEASDRAVRLLAENKIGPQAPFKTEHKFNPFTGAEEYMHSSWETAFLDTCISRGYPVTKNHGIMIPYTHPDGSTHAYVPDFYAFEDRTLYEVKGRHDEVDVVKWEAAQHFCAGRGWKFQVLFEEVSTNL